MLGRGSYFSLGDGRRLLIQRQGNGDIRIIAAAHRPETWLTDDGSPAGQGPEQVRELLRTEYAEFVPELRQLIDIAAAEFRHWPFFMLPFGLWWRHRPRVTMIGDAARLMAPFAGEGVNNAMADALSLVNLIVKRGSEDLDEAVRSYETEMFERIEPSMARTRSNLQNRFFTAEPVANMAKRLQKC